MAQRGTLQLIMLGIRLFLIGILASAVIGAGIYVMKLRSDNAILKANQIKLESAVAEQQELITSQKKDFEEILNANKKMNELVGLLITSIAGAGMYVMKLRSDNAILKANQMKLEEAVSSQKELIANQKKDFQEILDANKKMNELVSVLKKDLEDLDKRFNKKNRDVGKLAIAKTKSIERITNGASALATRCIEIASGSPLTEKEKNATKKSEINSECPSIANPNYVPY